MPLVLVERKNWIIHPKKPDRNDIEMWLRKQFGFMPIFANTEVWCKVCNEKMSGYDGIKHLQTVGHLAKREELIEQIIVLDVEYCDGCPNLMWEKNTWDDKNEMVCRLGYAYRDFDCEGIPVIDYVIDDDLTRPKKCIKEN